MQSPYLFILPEILKIAWGQVLQKVIRCFLDGTLLAPLVGSWA